MQTDVCIFNFKCERFLGWLSVFNQELPEGKNLGDSDATEVLTQTLRSQIWSAEPFVAGMKCMDDMSPYGSKLQLSCNICYQEDPQRSQIDFPCNYC